MDSCPNVTASHELGAQHGGSRQENTGDVQSSVGGRASQDGQGLPSTGDGCVKSTSPVQEPQVSSEDTSELSSHARNPLSDDEHQNHSDGNCDGN
ncbi:hypothetical protein V6N11_071639 [Hibiscus sabdariffa]|uniref:Uncharacterized protein n=1 Tax=Hibiscus sabdariffa TaxID=183260 RepID=A0ABR2U0N1_9ROSI